MDSLLSSGLTIPTNPAPAQPLQQPAPISTGLSNNDALTPLSSALQAYYDNKTYELDTAFMKERTFDDDTPDPAYARRAVRTAGLIAYVTSDLSPERAKQATATFGRTTPYRQDKYTGMLVGRALCANSGYAGDPLTFIRNHGQNLLGLQVPQTGYSTANELYSLIGTTFATQQRNAYTKAIQAEQARAKALEETRNRILPGAITRAVTNHSITPEEDAILKSCGITEDSLAKVRALTGAPGLAKVDPASTSSANAANSLNGLHLLGLEHNASLKGFSLFDRDGLYKAALIIGQDEKARLLYLNLMRIAGRQHRDSHHSSSFFDNFAASTANLIGDVTRSVSESFIDVGYSVGMGVASLAYDDAHITQYKALVSEATDAFAKGYAQRDKELTAKNSDTTASRLLWNLADFPTTIKEPVASTAPYLNAITAVTAIGKSAVDEQNLAAANAKGDPNAGFLELGLTPTARGAIFGASIYGTGWATGKLLGGLSKTSIGRSVSARIAISPTTRYAANVSEGIITEAAEELVDAVGQDALEETLDAAGLIEQRQKRANWKKFTDLMQDTSFWGADVGMNLVFGAFGYKGSRSKSPYKDVLQQLGFSQKEQKSIQLELVKAHQTGASAASLGEIVRQRVLEKQAANPQQFKERAIALVANANQQESLRAAAANGVLKHTLKKANISNMEPDQDGNYEIERVSRNESGQFEIVKEKYTEQQILDWLASDVNQAVTQEILYTQALVRGEQTARAATANADAPFSRIVSMLNAPAELLTKLDGKTSFDAETLTLFSQYAIQEIENRIARGESAESAANAEFGTTGATLGAVSRLAADFDTRVANAVAQGHISDAAIAQSNAYILPGKTPADNILMLARGEATAKDIAHDWLESFGRSRYLANPQYWQQALTALDNDLTSSGILSQSLFNHTPEERDDLEYIEAFSHLAELSFLADHGSLTLSDNSHGILDEVLDDLGAVQGGLELASALSQYLTSDAAKNAVGQALDPLRGILSEAGASLTDLLTTAEQTSPKTAADFILRHQQNIEQDVRTRLAGLATAATNPAPINTNIPKPDSPALPDSVTDTPPITTAQLAQLNGLNQDGTRPAPANATYTRIDPKKNGRSLINGLAHGLPDGSISGSAKLADISPHPTLGNINPAHIRPNEGEKEIICYRKADGTLQAIASLAYLSHAYNCGLENVPVRVYPSGKKYTPQWAAKTAAESKIRSGAASTADILAYLTKHALTRDAARRSNLIPKDTNGQELPTSRAAWLLLQHATKKTIADTISGKLSITQALSTIESKAADLLKAATQPSIPGFQTSSFSVIGKNARTWDKYASRAFKGRDDGMDRAEIDASQATVTPGVLMSDAERNLETFLDFFNNASKTTIQQFKNYIDISDNLSDALEYMEANRPGAEEVYSKLFKQRKTLELKIAQKLYEHTESLGIHLNGTLSPEEIIHLFRVYYYSRDLKHPKKLLEKFGNTQASEAVSLSEILDFPELYEAYPQLKHYAVTLGDFGTTGIRGQFTKSRNHIEIHRDLLLNDIELKSVLLHEIQHAIQSIEGFAKGGTPSSARAEYDYLIRNSRLSDRKELEISSIKSFLRWLNAKTEAVRKLKEIQTALKQGATEDEYIRLRDDFNDLIEELNSVSNISELSYEDQIKYQLPSLKLDSRYLDQFVEHYNKNIKSRKVSFPGYEKALNARLAEIKTESANLQELLNILQGKDDYDLYLRLGGEIEARNVQTRMSMDKNMRSAIPFNQTLDYPGEAIVPSSFSISEKSKNNTGQTQYNNINSSSHGNFVSFPVESGRKDSLSNGAETPDSVKNSNSRTNDGNGTKVPSERYSDSNGLRPDNISGIPEPLRASRAVLKNTSTIHRPAEHVVASYKENGFYTGDLHELKPGIESATLFQELINKAKESQGIFGDCVYTYSIDEYANMRLFITPDGMAGVALKPDGDMVSVFKNKNLKDRNESRICSLISLAISNGAKKADCYGSALVKLYGKFGFRAVAKDQFNPEYASESMQDSELMSKMFTFEDGKPDVVYLVFEGNTENPIASYNSRYTPDYNTSLTYTDYDTCVEIQTKEVERRFQNQPSSFSLTTSRRKYMPLSEAVKLEEYIAMEDYARRLYRDAIALAQANPKNKLDDAVRSAIHLRALLNAVFSRLPKDAQPWKALGHARKQIDSLTWAVSHSYANLAPHQAPGISPAEIEKYNESGYRDRRQWLTNKLSRLIVSVADSAARSIEAHACRTLLATAEAAIKTLLPKTQKSGKERRGITSADVYTKAIDFYKMFDWGTAERTKELTEISDTLNDPDITDQQRIEAEKRRQAILCFAGLNKESLPRVKAGVELLLAYIRTGRLKWEEKLLEERRATEAIQEAIATLEPKIEHSKTTAKEDKKRGGFANLFTSLLNPIQTLNIFATLPGKVGEIYTNLRARLATAQDNKTYAIQQAHQDAAHALDAILGIENKNSLTRQIERADFLTRKNRRKNTGIFKQGRVKITTFQFTQQDILDLQQIRQEQGQQAFITAIDKHRRKYDKEDALTQNIPYEEVFQDALSQLKSPDYRGGTIFVEHTGPRDTAHQEELILTPLQAANLWLLAQQPSYSNKYDQDGNLIERGMLDTLGYTDHVIAQLETFIGPQLRAYALWKREYLNTTGLFEAYEQHMGLPFPKEENYWPGAFDTVANNSGLDALQTAYAGNGVYNMLILRKKHLSEPNLSVDIEAAWEHAIAQHYHYIHLSPITRQLRAITRDADTRQRLRKIAGNAALDNVQTMLNTLDGAPALQLQAAAHANNLFMRWFTPFAKALLNMATGTTVKQTSAIGHALAYNGINWLNIAPKLLTTTLSGITRIKRDPGHKTPQEILKLKSFRVRINREDLGLIASRLAPGETQSKLAIIDLLGSRFLEYADAGANSIAMAAVYNTEYDTAKKIMLAANNGSPLTPEQQQQLADHCENTVSVLLKQAAQPLEKEDKPIIQQQKNFALSQNYFMMGEILSKVACFASIIKAGHAAAYGKPLPEARRIITHAWAKGLSFYSGMGIASQSILALLSYFIGSAPDAEDEDFSAWILSNILAGAIGFSYLNALPFIGEALSTAAQSIYGTHGVFATYATTGIGITYKDLKDLFKLLDPDKPTAERVYSGSNLLRITTTMLGFFCSGIKGANTVYELFSAANNINNLIRPGLQRAKNVAKKEQKELKALTRQQKSTRQPRYTSKRYTPPATP